MIETLLSDLAATTQARIAAVTTAEELETIRVEVLGRKGKLAEVSKDMGKLSPEQRGVVGKLLNAAKQSLEETLTSRQNAFAAAALAARLEREWIDLTVPAPGPGLGSLHPLTQISSPPVINLP